MWEQEDNPGLADSMRRRASAAVSGLRKRLTAGAVEPPSVPVFFNLMAEAEMWPNYGRIGEQRLTLVQYWRQMQRGMSGAGAAAAPDSAPAASETSPAIATVHVRVNGQAVTMDAHEPIVPAAVAAPVPGPHTAFKLEDFDDELDRDRGAAPEREPLAGATAAGWAPASMVFARPPAASEPAPVDGAVSQAESSDGAIPAYAAELAEAGTTSPPVTGLLQAAGILIDPPADPIAPTSFEPVADDAIDLTPLESVGVAAGGEAMPQPVEAAAPEPELLLGSLDEFTDQPVYVPSQEVPVADLEADAFVVEGMEAAFASVESVARADASAVGLEEIGDDLLADAAGDLSSLAAPMVHPGASDVELQDAVADLRFEDLAPDVPLLDSTVVPELGGDVSFDLSALTADHAEPLVDLVAEEAGAEPVVEAMAPETLIVAVEQPSVAVESEAGAEAEPVAEDVAAHAVEPAFVEPVADHAEPLVDVAAESHEPEGEAPDAHEPAAPVEFIAPVAAAPDADTHEESAEVVDLPVPPEVVSAYAAPLMAEDESAEAHDEEPVEAIEAPAHVPAAAFVEALAVEPVADQADHSEETSGVGHDVEMPAVADASVFAAPLTDTGEDHGVESAAQADLDEPAALADDTFAEVMHAGLEPAVADEATNDLVRAAADMLPVPAAEADGVWHDAIAAWSAAARDTRLRRAGVIPMPDAKPLPVPVVSGGSAIPALERFMRSAQARRRRVAGESVA